MKKIIAMLMTIVVLSTVLTVFVGAATSQTDTVTSASTTAAATAQQAAPTASGSTAPQTAAVKVPVIASTASTEALVSTPAVTGGASTVIIAPDSLLYPIKQMIESVQVALTFSAGGKAELLVSFANERLNEANLMTERNKQQLVNKVMKAYVETMDEAHDKAAEAAQASTDVKPLLDSIQLTEDNAGKIIIKAVGVIPADTAEQLKSAVAAQVQKTIAMQAASEAKNQFKLANEQVEQAKENLEMVNQAGSSAMVTAAQGELAKAQQARDKALELKKQAEAYKGQIISSLKQDEEKEKVGEQEKDKVKEKDKEKVKGKGNGNGKAKGKSEFKKLKQSMVQQLKQNDEEQNDEDQNDEDQNSQGRNDDEGQDD